VALGSSWTGGSNVAVTLVESLDETGRRSVMLTEATTLPPPGKNVKMVASACSAGPSL
jgi:hypothetical protein